MNKLQKYAELTVRVGANVQKGQYVMIFCSLENKKFAEMLANECYKCKAKRVIVEWTDEYITRLTYKNCSLETLSEVEKWKIEKWNWRKDNLPCIIQVDDENPDMLKGIDSVKISKSQQSLRKAIKPIREQMEDKYQWTIVAMPTAKWAKKVYPDLTASKAKQKLLDDIFKICRVDDGDVVENWNKHNQQLRDRYTKLNEYNFEFLHYKNSAGTNFKVGLAEGHKWEGGMEKTLQGISFNPNMPTEEVFTMPHCQKAEGTLVSTKPLVNNGVVIEGIKFEFKDGKIVKATATKNQDALQHLVDMDENSCRLGEVALVPYASPISQTNTLFYTTLIDENASCHFAIGDSYNSTLIDSDKMTREEMSKRGANSSIIHVDFMVGSSDLSIVGITHDGKEVQVFKDGNFTF